MQKYFSLIVLVAIGLGFAWRAPGIFVSPYVLYLLVIIMTLSFMKMDFRQLKHLKNDWWRYFVLVLLIYLLPTLIVWLFSGVLEKDIFIGLMLAAAVPSAISAIAISDLLGGEPVKALVATTLAYFVAPFVTPFLVWLFAHQIVEINFVGMMITIAELIFLPMVLAEIIRFIGLHKHLHKIAEINILLLVAIIWGVIAPSRDLIFAHWQQALWALLIVLVILVVSILISVWFGRTKKEDITWSVVDTYKNFALSSVLALSLFGPLAALGPVAYSIADNLIIFPLQWWARRKRKQ